ncbi:hypothetical protein EB439_23935 [Escherichia coli]|nr:hypothetical protein [Escherichia coli]
MYQEGIYGIIRRNFGDVLIGDSVETLIIDSFSASVINMLITEGGCLLKTDELIGFHLNYWKPNNFRLISIWYLM